MPDDVVYNIALYQSSAYIKIYVQYKNTADKKLNYKRNLNEITLPCEYQTL